MEFQIIIAPSKGPGFELITRAKVGAAGQYIERNTSQVHASTEAEVWSKIGELAQERMVQLAEEAG